jgi:hypothetical protein
MWGKRKSGQEEEGPAAGGASPSPQVGSANEPLLETRLVAGAGTTSKPNGAEHSVTAQTDASAVPERDGSNANRIWPDVHAHRVRPGTRAALQAPNTQRLGMALVLPPIEWRPQDRWLVLRHRSRVQARHRGGERRNTQVDWAGSANVLAGGPPAFLRPPLLL